jgi:hypothetical protein
LKESFALQFIAKDPTLASFMTDQFDGEFFRRISSSEGVTSTIIRRTLYMHL